MQYCSDSWLDQIGSEIDPNLMETSDISNTTKKCRQRCNIQVESMVATTSSFPNRETFAFR